MTQEQIDRLTALRDAMWERIVENWIEAGLLPPGNDLSHNPLALEESTR